MANETSSAQADHDVVIVGLGPTGATLANILGVYGLDVLVLEREAAVYPLPRAVHFDDEAMRVFQSIGLAEAIGRDARVNVGTKFVDANMDLLLDWSRPLGDPQNVVTIFIPTVLDPGVAPEGKGSSHRIATP